MEIPVRVMHEGAEVPRYAHDGDAGCDLVAAESATLAPSGGRALVGTGISIEVPPGHGGFVLPRSGLAMAHGVTCINAPGLIDSGYRGEVRVALINLDPREEYTVHIGDRIAQLVIIPVPTLTFAPTESLSASARSAGGFGSSGR